MTYFQEFSELPLKTVIMRSTPEEMLAPYPHELSWPRGPPQHGQPHAGLRGVRA